MVSIVLFTAGLSSVFQPIGWTWALLVAVAVAIKAGKYGLVLNLMIFSRYFQGSRNRGKRWTAWGVLSLIVVLNFLGVYSSLSEYIGKEVATLGAVTNEIVAVENEVEKLEERQAAILADISDDADFAVTATSRKAVALGLTDNQERITALNDRLVELRAEAATEGKESHLAGLFALGRVLKLPDAVVPVLIGLLVSMLLDPLEVFLIYVYAHLTSKLRYSRRRLRRTERRLTPKIRAQVQTSEIQPERKFWGRRLDAD